MSKPGRCVLHAAALVAVASVVWMGVAGNWDAVFRFAVIAVFMLATRAAASTLGLIDCEE